MEKEFELVVQHVPSPDAEQRLRTIFKILLDPTSDGEGELCPIDPDQTHEPRKRAPHQTQG